MCFRLIEDWGGFDALVCVDAAAPVTTPGRIHRIDLAASDCRGNVVPVESCVRPGDAIELARVGLTAHARWRLRDRRRGFDGGAPITPDVAAAVDEVAGCVVAEVENPPADCRKVGDVNPATAQLRLGKDTGDVAIDRGRSRCGVEKDRRLPAARTPIRPPSARFALPIAATAFCCLLRAGCVN